LGVALTVTLTMTVILGAIDLYGRPVTAAAVDDERRPLDHSCIDRR